MEPTQYATTTGASAATRSIAGESSSMTGTRIAMKMPTLIMIVKAAKMSMIQEYKIFARKSTFFLKNL